MTNGDGHSRPRNRLGRLFFLVLVIAVVALLIGVSFFVLIEKPVISVSNGNTTYDWYGDFTHSVNTSSYFVQLPNVTSSTSVMEGENPAGYLNASIRGTEYMDTFTAKGLTWEVYVMIFQVNGSLIPNLHPKSMDVSFLSPLNDTIPPVENVTSVGWSFGTTKADNVTNKSWQEITTMPLEFVRQSSTDIYRYYFSLADIVTVDVYNPEATGSFNMQFNVSMLGLSEPVYTSITLNVEEVK